MARGVSPSSAEKRSPAAGSTTPERIFEAAEELFAREGIDRVTLRQIARASGQGNVAAVQYHFGGKEALLAKIVERHQREIDERRRALLAEHERSGEGEDLHALLQMLVAPLAEKLDDASGRAYLQIQTQRVTRDGLYPATRSLAKRISAAVGGSPRDPLRDRFAVLLLFQALAERARDEAAGRPQPKSRRTFTRSLVSALHGLYLGPPD
jgi:AcrR family transcriptional regulator